MAPASWKIENLANEQLQVRCIVPSTRSWNSPAFVIQKKSAMWHLLHDLRKINAILEYMGPLLPLSTMIPQNWHLTIINLKDYFFTIPVHPEDASTLAFSVPSLNMQEPLQRFHWVVLSLKPAYVNFWRKIYHIGNMEMYLINMKIGQHIFIFFICIWT